MSDATGQIFLAWIWKINDGSKMIFFFTVSEWDRLQFVVQRFRKFKKVAAKTFLKVSKDQLWSRNDGAAAPFRGQKGFSTSSGAPLLVGGENKKCWLLLSLTQPAALVQVQKQRKMWFFCSASFANNLKLAPVLNKEQKRKDTSCLLWWNEQTFAGCESPTQE